MGFAGPTQACPYCNAQCECDWVDVGVGFVQCGPYYCPDCGASEAHCDDQRAMTEEEARTGWYAPGTPVSELANTCCGVLVDHQTAKTLYDSGLLDSK